MPIILDLVPTRPSFCSGEVLTATLEVRNVAGSDGASAGPLELAGVNVDFRGTERIDRSWIASSYAPSKGPVARDGKREVRPVVETPPARLVMQDYTLMLGESRMWLVRFRLPKTLPPSFKGVAVRYSYTLQATAQFATPKPLTPSMLIPLSSSAFLAETVDGANPFAVASAADQASSSSSGVPSVWPNSGFASSVAQAESAVVANELKAPSRWQIAEAEAAIHLWPPMAAESLAKVYYRQKPQDDSLPNLLAEVLFAFRDGDLAECAHATCLRRLISFNLGFAGDASGSRGSSGSVAAGDEAALPAVPYQLGYALRDVGVDFQELGEAAKARGSRQHSFTFLQQGGQQWQPAFLTSIDHMPSQLPRGPPTPKLAMSSNGLQQPLELLSDQTEQRLSTLEEDAATPISELTLGPGGDTDDLEMLQNASSTARSARSTSLTAGRQNSLTSPGAIAGEAVLRSYNLRLGEAALVRVALHAPLDGPLVLGSVLAGTFDFRASQAASGPSSAAPRCIQVSVLLETEEVIDKSFQSSKSARLQSGAIRKVWDEHVEVTSDLMLTHFMFSLPLDAPASFATHLVSLQWVLRFEFTTSAAKPAGWLSGGSTPEQIVWALPVLVRPPVAVA